MTTPTGGEGKSLPAVVVPELQRTISEPIHFHRNIYDMLIALGPSTRDELRAAPLLYTTESWRDYQARHPEQRKNRSPSIQQQRAAETEQLDLALIQGTEKGWLVRRPDGTFDIGALPPDHTPLATMSTATTATDRTTAAAKRIQTEDNMKAFAVLRNEKLSRRPTTLARRKLLRESIERVGQLQPVIRWHRVGTAEVIIVDGVVRLDVLTDLGIEPWYVDLPAGMEPWEVLGRRLAAELELRSTKEESDAARDKYIFALTKEGISQQKIADILATTQQNVSRIQARLKVVPKGQNVPSDAQVDQWVHQAAAGWSFERMSVESGWSRAVIHKHLTRRANASTFTNTTRTVTVNAAPEMSTRQSDVLRATIELGLCTEEEMEDHLGVSRRDHRRAERKKLEAAGYIERVAERGAKTKWRATDSARAGMPEVVPLPPKLRVVADPDPIPTDSAEAKAPKAPKPPLPPRPPPERSVNLLVDGGFAPTDDEATTKVVKMLSDAGVVARPRK